METAALQTAAAARALGIHPDTLRAMVRRGEVPAWRVRGQLRFDPADLAEYRYHHRVRPAVEAQKQQTALERVRAVLRDIALEHAAIVGENEE